MRNRGKGVFTRGIAVLIAAIVSLSQVNAALVGYWDFNSSSDVGKAEVSSDLTAFGGASYTSSGKYGGGLLLNGSGYLAVDSSFSFATGLPTGNSSYTVTAWILPSTTPGSYGIIGWGTYGTYGAVNAFRTSSTNNCDIDNYSWGYEKGYDVTAQVGIYDNTWHNVAVTYDAASHTKTLYLDGVLVKANSDTLTLNVTGNNFTIGRTYTNEYFVGILDEVKVYNTALSTSELNTSLQAAPEPSSLILLTGAGALFIALARRRGQKTV
jgi:hypothetical protein